MVDPTPDPPSDHQVATAGSATWGDLHDGVTPSALRSAVLQAFAATGPLARADARYTPRQVQLEMACAVAEAIEGREALVAEAGTGVGKTFAYLVPTLLSGARALVSTAT